MELSVVGNAPVQHYLFPSFALSCASDTNIPCFPGTSKGSLLVSSKSVHTHALGQELFRAGVAWVIMINWLGLSLSLLTSYLCWHSSTKLWLKHLWKLSNRFPMTSKPILTGGKRRSHCKQQQTMYDLRIPIPLFAGITDTQRTAHLQGWNNAQFLECTAIRIHAWLRPMGRRLKRDMCRIYVSCQHCCTVHTKPVVGERERNYHLRSDFLRAKNH